MSYRIGVIGTGDSPENPDSSGYAMAYRHAPGYQRLDDCELVACADIVRSNAEQFADTFDVPGVYEDYEVMLEEADVDVVSVCVPPDVHADVVVGCAQYGDLEAIHCEKPMATTWEACAGMGRACERKNIQLTINHQRRTGPIYRRAKSLVASGRIGTLERIEWTAKNLFDAGTHMFDLSCFYVDENEPEWVLAGLDYRTENRQFGVHNENEAVAEWAFENGVTGHAVTGRGEEALGARLRLHGDEGTIEVGPVDGPPLRIRTDRSLGWSAVDAGETIWGNRKHVRLTGYVRWGVAVARERLRDRAGDDHRGYPSHVERAVRSVIEGVRTGQEPELSWRNAIRSTRLIFGAWESARRRARVDFPLEIDDNPLESMVENGQLLVSPSDNR